MSTTNRGRRVWDRNGTKLVDETLFQFFGFESAGDPIVVFDRDSSRWFALALKDIDSLGLAVSRTSNPIDRYDWDFHQSVLGIFPDYPTMSVGANQVFFTWKLGGGQAEIAWVDKEALLNGQTPPITRHVIAHIPGQTQAPGRVLQCFEMYDQPSPSIAYFITDSHTLSGDNNFVRLYALDAASGQPPETFDLMVPLYKTVPGTVVKPGGTVSCVPWFKFGPYRNGSAWAAHTIGDDDSDTASVRWYEIAMNDWPISGQNPTLVQSGTIDPISNPVGDTASAIYPAIHVDDSGHGMSGCRGRNWRTCRRS